MPDNSTTFHESEDALSPETRDRHRAIASLMEEMEAVDWYDQRIEATSDAQLAAILAHNRDEEKEHAAMVLEWLRQRDRVLDGELRTYLFRPEAVLAESEGDDEPEPPGSRGVRADGSLGIGSLRELAG